MYGFSKNKRSNINLKELKALRQLAKELLGYSNKQLKQAVKGGSFVEVK